MNIEEFRQKYPTYNDIPDTELTEKLHAEFYSDMPYEEFKGKFLPAIPEHPLSTEYPTTKPSITPEHPLSMEYPTTKPSLLEAAKTGRAESIAGRISGLEPEFIPETRPQRIVMGGTKILYDLPFYVLGGMIGGPAGAFGLPYGLEKTFAPGEKEKPFTERLTGAVTETLKGEALGAVMGVVGRIKQPLLRFFSEIGTLTAGGAALEGKMPTVDEAIDATILLGGLKGVNKGIHFLSEVRAKRPDVVAKELSQKAVSERKPLPEIVSREVKEVLGKEIEAEELKLTPTEAPKAKPPVPKQEELIRVQPEMPKTKIETVPQEAFPMAEEIVRRKAEGKQIKNFFSPSLSEIQEGTPKRQYDLQEKVKPKDVLSTSEWVMSPEFLAKKDPIASDIVRKTIEANQRFQFNHQADSAFFSELKTQLTSKERLEIKNILEKKAKPSSEKVQEAANRLRDYFDKMRDDVRNYKREMYRKYLSYEENEAIDRVLQGERPDVVANIMDVDPEVLKEIVLEYKAIDKWGLDDYVTHMERGIYRLVDENDVTRAVGATKRDAIRKAKVFLDRNPEMKTLWLDTSFSSSHEFPTLLSRGQYLRLKNRLRKATELDMEEIQRVLHEKGTIVAIKPTQKFAGPLERRYNVLEGEPDVFDVLPAYSYIMRKKIELDPVLADARMNLMHLPPNLREAMTNYLQDVKGRKTIMDKVADQILERYGAKPFAYSRSVSGLTTLAAWRKLGYRPIAGIVNFASGQGHIWTKVGTRYMAEATSFMKTPEGKTYLEAEAPYLGTSFAQEAKIRPLSPSIIHPMGMFQLPEPINRKVSLTANYLYAKNTLGIPDEAAHLYARRALRFQQFTYDIASLPKAMRGPTRRLVLQFKPYLVKELEFISSLRGAEIPRYIAMTIALGGPRAIVFTLKTIPILGALGLLDDVEDWINTNLPRASRGVPGAFGVDITAPVTFQFPERVEDLAGPTIGDMIKLYNEVGRPALRGEKYLGEKAKEALRGTAPVLYYWNMLIDSAMDDEGWVKNKDGQKLFKADRWDKFKLGLGATPLEWARKRTTLGKIKRDLKIEAETRERIIDEISGHILRGEPLPENLVNDALNYGVSISAIFQDLKAKQMTPEERQLRRTPRYERGKVLEKLEK